jgi:hypothetical protein
MAQRRLWSVAAWIFIVINVGGGLYAAATGEWDHAAVHVVLTFAGLYAAGRVSRRTPGPESVADRDTEQRMRRLQQSLDVIAVEVERIGEAQRFAAKIIAEEPAEPPAQRARRDV